MILFEDNLYHYYCGDIELSATSITELSIIVINEANFNIYTLLN